MELTLSQKQEAYDHCLAILNERIKHLKNQIGDAQTSASEDTKSSAGDKYETGREMMKQEINKLNLQLTQANQMRQQLNRYKPAISFQNISPGSLVLTSEGLYYVSIGLGKIQVGAQVCMAISMQSPIGKALHGHQVGDHLSFMGREIHVYAIC